MTTANKFTSSPGSEDNHQALVCDDQWRVLGVVWRSRSRLSLQTDDPQSIVDYSASTASSGRTDLDIVVHHDPIYADVVMTSPSPISGSIVAEGFGAVRFGIGLGSVQHNACAMMSFWCLFNNQTKPCKITNKYITVSIISQTEAINEEIIIIWTTYPVTVLLPLGKPIEIN